MNPSEDGTRAPFGHVRIIWAQWAEDMTALEKHWCHRLALCNIYIIK
jgi:hypothetical protein